MRIAALFFALALAACGRDLPLPVENSRELVVLTRAGLTTYTVDSQGGAGGFEYDLVREFAKDQGLKIRIISTADDTDLLTRLKQGEGHLAVAWSSPAEDPEIRSSTPYFQSSNLIVTHEASLPLRTAKQLNKRTVHVIAGSRQERSLQKMRKRVSSLSIAAVQDTNELALMEGAASRRFEAILISDAAFKIGGNFYPELQDAMELGVKQPIVWLFAPEVSPEFLVKANDFLARMASSGELDRLKDRYFGHVDRLTTDDVSIFIEQMRNTLPQYRPLFQEAQIQTGIDWRLLAALAYQESRWEPLATSPTGVRGIMMLTADTADSLRVRNRLDPAQSIRAGAQYLSDLRDSLPAEIREPDRLWLALAAYNLGMGHLNGARYLAKTLGADPDSWYEMKKVLPLLAKPQYYKRLKSGKGRGGEAVIMTENIRVYADILNRFEPPYEPMKRKSEKFIWKSFQARPDTDAAPAVP